MKENGHDECSVGIIGCLTSNREVETTHLDCALINDDSTSLTHIEQDTRSALKRENKHITMLETREELCQLKHSSVSPTT